MENGSSPRPLHCYRCKKELPRMPTLWSRTEDVHVYFQGDEGLSKGRYLYAHVSCGATLGSITNQCSIKHLLNYQLGGGDENSQFIGSMLPKETLEKIYLDWHPEKQAARTALQSTAKTVAKEVTTSGVVYVLHAQGTSRIKIGHSATFGVRLATLQTASPYPLVVVKQIRTPDHVALERRLHERFSAYRQHGEWFELPQDVLLAFLGESFEKEEIFEADQGRQDSRYLVDGSVTCPACTCGNIDIVAVSILSDSLRSTFDPKENTIEIGSNSGSMLHDRTEQIGIDWQCMNCKQGFALWITHLSGGVTDITWNEISH